MKIGSLKVPYAIKTEGTKKIFQICSLRIPFSTYTKEEKKYYKIFGISLQLPFLDKYFISQSKSNFLMREQLTDEKIKEIATQIFKEKVGYTPDLDNPRSFNEKIFWMKLHDHNPMITKCCDKFAVKEYVTEKLGPGHVIPTILSWENSESIDFAVLPEQYVMKVNWSSGYNIIVKDKSKISEEEIRKKVAHWMHPQQNSYYQTFNWGYKNMKPVVYAEQYMEQMDGQLYDYKFYCCNGKVEFMFIATDRHEKNRLTYDFFDRDFHKLDFYYGNRAHSECPLHKPRFYDEMIKSAEVLAEGFPFVRVDFYETENQFYVGEMTFYSGGGILPFDPVEWDYKLGEYIPVPDKKGEVEYGLLC